MISFPLFKRNMLFAIKLSLIFVAVLTMYTVIIIYMFDPDLAEMLSQYQEVMPGMMAAVGMSGTTGTLIEFIHTYLYGFIMLVFPMIFGIILVNKMILKYVDSGSMACLLASPNSRTKIITTQLLSVILSITFLIAVITVIGIVSSSAMFPGELDVEKYIQLNISTLLLHFAISGIGVLAACFFNEARGYFSVGAGLPILFYLINMLANMGENLEKLKYFTIFTLTPYEEILTGSNGILSANLFLAGLAIVLYLCGAIVFVKKDLPI